MPRWRPPRDEESGGVLGVMKRLANRTLLQSFLFDSSMTRNSGLYEAERPIVGLSGPDGVTDVIEDANETA